MTYLGLALVLVIPRAVTVKRTQSFVLVTVSLASVILPAGSLMIVAPIWTRSAQGKVSPLIVCVCLQAPCHPSLADMHVHATFVSQYTCSHMVCHTFVDL